MTRPSSARDNGHMFSPPLDSVKTYLTGTGWKLEDDDERTSLWGFEGNEVQVVLPARPDYTDFTELLVNALRTVAYVEHRQLAEVTSDLSLGGADTLAVKLTPQAPPGEAPLGLVNLAVGALRNLVVASASAALDVR